jgi:hypothetical protein
VNKTFPFDVIEIHLPLHTRIKFDALQPLRFAPKSVSAAAIASAMR